MAVIVRIGVKGRRVTVGKGVEVGFIGVGVIVDLGVRLGMRVKVGQEVMVAVGTERVTVG